MEHCKKQQKRENKLKNLEKKYSKKSEETIETWKRENQKLPAIKPLVYPGFLLQQRILKNTCKITITIHTQKSIIRSWKMRLTISAPTSSHLSPDVWTMGCGGLLSSV